MIKRRNFNRKKVYKLTSKGDAIRHLLFLEYMEATSKTGNIIPRMRI
ncbi:MAG: hypothetical protein H3Z53_12610 [archaeon]|nr:hypothetical protein [archaeon]